MSNFTEFLTALGAFESGIDTTQQQNMSWLQYLRVFDPQHGNVDPSSVNINNPADLAALQYHVFNTLGFMGKYQFGEPLLIDLGYYVPASTGYYGTTATNEWKGEWTGKNGVHSKADFMSNVQELAIREAFSMNVGIINDYLAQAGKTIDDFIGREFTYTRLGETHVAHVTMSGILASAHLQGPGGVAQLFLHNVASSDEYGTNILFYMDKYAGYNSPFGASGDDLLSGSDFSETFLGGAGHNTYQTGNGNDKIVITNNAGNHDIIQDFNIGSDVISLSKFPGLTFQNLSITNVNGSAQITFPNGQILTLQNVLAQNISAEQFVYGPYKVTWNANSGDTVFDNFNPQYDVIDLNYAFASSNIKLYEENGSTVIDIVGNNQRIILQGIDLDDLSPASFIKAPVDFATVAFGINADHTPPIDTGGSTPPVDQNPGSGNQPGNSQTGGQGGDVFSYTWNWGSHSIVNNFDAALDKIDLKNFWTSFDQLGLHNDAQGNAVIDLTNLNNQTITIEGVSVNNLTAANFVGVSGTMQVDGSPTIPVPPVVPEVPVIPPVVTPPVTPPADGGTPPDAGSNGQNFSYTWNWGANTVINNFDVTKDVINLQSFWTNYDAITIHDNAQGNAVIDLSGINNQTITLQGISSANLSANNIVGVTGAFSNAVPGGSTGGNTNTNPDAGNSGSNPTTPTPVVDVVQHQMNDSTLAGQNNVKDVFNFTWGWGSHKVITGFNTAEDKVDLHHFWTTRDALNVHNDAQGNAVIDLTALNNQTITLLGVSADQLHDSNIIV